MIGPWVAVAALSLLALALRVLPRLYQVFGIPGFVNFSETDAWWHVRMMQQWASTFPARLTVDPLARINAGQTVDTGPFFDLLPALLGWAFQLSPETLQVLAAWYPALLGTLLVPVTFLAGRAIFGPAAGLWSAAVVATLPGHFLATSSLGFTDHHVMEALLTALLLYLLVKPAPALWLGLTLAAYLLTFPGGAFVVALITLWYWLEGLRGDTSDSRRFANACLIALPFVWWNLRLYLMPYTLAAVTLAAALLWLLPLFPKRRVVYLAVSALGAAAGLALVSLIPGDERLLDVVRRLTASNSLAPTVAELQSLTGVKGYFSLEYPWREFGVALICTLTGLPLLAEDVWRRPQRARTLFLLWATLFFVMAMSQARMTYYFGVSAALLSGYLMSQLRPRSFAAVALAAILVLPNLRNALASTAPSLGQVTPDWLTALHYLRDQTPRPAASYSVMAWWDFGYWITAIAERVPVSNPTQSGAEEAADFLLATNDGAAREILQKTRAKYIALDSRLLLLGDGERMQGAFLSLFPYTKRYRQSDYVFVDGRQVYLRARYFESMLVRLFLADGRASKAPARANFAVVAMEGGALVRKGRFEQLDAARQAAASCPGCEVVSEDPLMPCIDLPPSELADPVFASATEVLRYDGRSRAAVQIFAVR
ncbi:MAG: hypothetical protein K2X03_23335 [Bryobacteraceae bacterium]|nr:hypothetical protein [Bryobacteraceae bacterium]